MWDSWTFQQAQLHCTGRHQLVGLAACSLYKGAAGGALTVRQRSEEAELLALV